ncbi:hypothetical protein [Burkholderia glumae]|uniref:hypothetical protein n=1 Tax=Burkholderia glumae TaxID=337 RepID=UPI00215128D2|nr:hypothetical protein [Burkholderia glumae]
MSAIVRFLMLNEALALCLAGIARVNLHAGGFDIGVFDETAHETLRATWFARALDQGSHAGTIARIGRLSRAGAAGVRDLELLIERILDQDLAIPWRRLTDQGKALKSVQHIYNAVALVAVVAVASARSESVKMTRASLARLDLDFSAVSGLLHRQAQALVTDQFVMREQDSLYIRIERMSKGLRNYYRALECEFGERDALREHIGGIFFEKTHIRQRIDFGEDYRERYRTVNGFDRYMVQGDIPNEADVEFIIEDTQLQHYYFVQVKHSLLGEKAFFNSIIEATQNDIGKGLHQLREAKRLLEANLLHKTLTSRNLEGATAANSSFVLLHNIAQLDFQGTNDGITLYDWATFRNLLKDAECQVGWSNDEPEFARLPSPLRIHDPMAVIRRLLNEHPAYRSMGADVWSSDRATTRYSVERTRIQVTGLGI